LNGKQVNTIKALWNLRKDQITEKEHNEFFKFICKFKYIYIYFTYTIYIAHSYTDPMYNLQYTTDSPIDIRSLFYIGQQNSEKFGLGRMEPGVNLFSKKVLIQAKAKGLLPDWLRFIKGVVDSEDIPLNISREFLQDSSLIRKIKNVITRKVLRWLEEESKKDPKKYIKFFDEFGAFLKEGICTDFGMKEDIAKLLRFESSALPEGEMTSLDDYIARMPTSQSQIYFLTATNRKTAETSPYYEGFKASKEEVLFMYSPLDDFVMTNNLVDYKDKKIVSAESHSVTPTANTSEQEGALSTEETDKLIKWLKEALEDRVSAIKSSSRLVDSPAIIVGHDSSAYRRMMKYVDPQRAPTLSKQQLEINPKHPVIKKLYISTTTKPRLAHTIAEQVFIKVNK
jgi:TNF receptor-associated protein 1